LQAALVYVFFLPSLAVYTVLAGFVARVVLLLIPGWWRWAGYAAVVVSLSALYATVLLHGAAGSGRTALMALYRAATFAQVGLLVYGLSRLAAMAREMEAVRDELARLAAVWERLRVARDVHDLLDRGLSAIALKADLAGKLIGRDDAWAAAEIQELSRTCAAACADVRLVTADGQKLSLAGRRADGRCVRRSLTSCATARPRRPRSRPPRLAARYGWRSATTGSPASPAHRASGGARMGAAAWRT
jgi:two-component system, NarL family, sensor histidine kinase DesK